MEYPPRQPLLARRTLLTDEQIAAAAKMSPQEKAETFGLLITWIPAGDGAMDAVSPISGNRYSIRNGVCSCPSSRRCWHLLAFDAGWTAPEPVRVRGFATREEFEKQRERDFA